MTAIKETAEQRFAGVIDVLNQLVTEGYEIPNLSRLSMSATAKVKLPEKAPGDKPVTVQPVKTKAEVKS